MPIYEYVCAKCNEKFSLLQSIKCGKNDTKCPKCGGEHVRKMISSFCCSSGSGTDFSHSMPSGGFSGGG